MSADADNRARLATVARVLEGSGIRVVFVGGATVALMVDELAGAARATDDIDCVVGVRTYADYAELFERLRTAGFLDVPQDGVACRLSFQGIAVDFMPLEALPLAPSSPYFARIWAEPVTVPLTPGVTVPVAPAVLLFATKLEAFRDRGAHDPYLSKDLEDLITLLDGRASLLDELVAAPGEIRRAAAEWADWMLRRRDAENLVAAWFRGFDASERANGVARLILQLRGLA